MSTNKFEVEIEAIKNVLAALEPLEEKVRHNVIEYVLKSLGISMTSMHVPQQQLPFQNFSKPQDTPPTPPGEKHIKQIKEEKNPQSAIEMAAIVAYYLSEIAPNSERKDSVNTKDMETYFKIADYKLPDVTYLLTNSKNAGYFDGLGNGQYKLNAVGYNLVAHNLPRDGNKRSYRKRASRKTKAASKKQKGKNVKR